MMKNVVDIDFENIRYSIPSFITIITMVLSYSITNGIGMGILSFVFLDVIIYLIDRIRKRRDKKVKPQLETNWVTGVIFILFLIYFLVPTIF